MYWHFITEDITFRLDQCTTLMCTECVQRIRCKVNEPYTNNFKRSLLRLHFHLNIICKKIAYRRRNAVARKFLNLSNLISEEVKKKSRKLDKLISIFCHRKIVLPIVSLVLKKRRSSKTPCRNWKLALRKKITRQNGACVFGLDHGTLDKAHFLQRLIID